MQSFQLVKEVSNLQIILCAQKYYFTKTVIFTQDIIILRFSSNSWITVHIYPLYYTVYWTVNWIWKQYYVFCAIYTSKHTFTNKTIWKILIFQ